MERALFVGLVVFLVTAFVNGIPRFLAAKSELPQMNDDCGRICLPKGTALFFIVLCLGFVAFGAFGMIADPSMFWVCSTLVAIFSYFIWGTVLASKERGSVLWSKGGIEGPCRVYPIPFLENRKHVPWEGIKSYQERAHGVVILKSNDGTNLVWSNYFAGADFLKNLIQRKCPHAEFK